MKKTIIAQSTPPNWDAEALYNKALRHAENMLECEAKDWQYALWSSFSLELLARAALANVSPALLADNHNSWSNLYHSLGFTPRESKFSPKSIAVSEVFKRLKEILSDFSGEHLSFCIEHTVRRNSELHSGVVEFGNNSDWQSKFYSVCEVLLSSMDKNLSDFFGKEEAKTAQILIAADADKSASSVKTDVEAYKKVWTGKAEEEKVTLINQALVWAARHKGHRVICPSCGSKSIISGDAIKPPTQKIADDIITETQEYLPNQFECIACGLKIAGFSRLKIVGLSERYNKTQDYSAYQYYEPEDDYAGFEDDNNEP